MHNSDDLIKKTQQAERQVSVGGIYTHYRNPKQTYKVLAIAINETTEEPCVVYQALYGDQLIWVRSVSVWCESIEYNGQIVLRFVKVQKL